MSHAQETGDEFEVHTQRLFLRAHGGDREALQALVERLDPALQSWLHMRMRPAFRARVDPEEVRQEVWARVLPKLAELEPTETNFRAWLIGVARHVLLELSRKSTRTTAGSSILRAQTDPATGVSTCLQRSDALLIFLSRIDEAHPEERRLVLLRGVEALPLAEVAQELGLNLEAAKKRWQRLRQRLEAQGIPDFLTP